MSFDSSDFWEDTDDESKSYAGAALSQGRATYNYIFSPEKDFKPIDILNLCNFVFGTTSVTPVPANGQLVRSMPLAHPVYPYWFATSIAKIAGVGAATRSSKNPQDPLYATGTQLPEFSFYPQYRLTIEFSPMGYTVAPNSKITTVNNTPPGSGWYPPAAYNSGSSGVLTSYFYANEWTRFVEWTSESSDDYIHATQGQQSYIGAPGINTQFPGTPKLFLQNQKIRMWWRQVPYRFISSPNSYIQKAIGRINQNPFYIWNSGQLLYNNYRAIPYTPPVGQFLSEFNFPGKSVINFPSSYTVQKLVDIEFDFVLTNRTLAPGNNPPLAFSNATGFPFKYNWIYQQGHNLLPHYADRLFHYAGSTMTRQVPGVGPVAVLYGAGTPTFFSFPFELFFTDPDSPGNTAFL